MLILRRPGTGLGLSDDLDTYDEAGTGIVPPVDSSNWKSWGDNATPRNVKKEIHLSWFGYALIGIAAVAVLAKK